ncbi:RNA polymerase sigma factor [Clostridium sp. YIM B02505]|uniref:RNA polymerase sigma factor n=1 Tax=Clostridium yunnanense TaxID=2800325 RepID=A0ABS1ETW1_9CLOT|nr:RNA polymerase sigma factor [Clostridium yunnanense]MBK1812831.1 RNA polymerase sigma factor [Clostridium yunnanense]
MEKLTLKAQNGNSEAFIEAINCILPQLYKIAKTRLDSEDDIGDAVQETIISAFENIGDLKNVEFFKTWVVRILINKCNDIYKKGNKVVYLETLDNSAEINSLSNEAAIDKIDIEEAINHLSKDYKTTLNLYYVSGFTTKEIGQILNQSEGTIKSRLSRARNILKNHLINYREVE